MARGQPGRVLGRQLQEVEGDALRGLRSDAGKAAELVDQRLDGGGVGRGHLSSRRRSSAPGNAWVTRSSGADACSGPASTSSAGSIASSGSRIGRGASAAALAGCGSGRDRRSRSLQRERRRAPAGRSGRRARPPARLGAARTRCGGARWARASADAAVGVHPVPGGQHRLGSARERRGRSWSAQARVSSSRLGPSPAGWGACAVGAAAAAAASARVPRAGGVGGRCRRVARPAEVPRGLGRGRAPGPRPGRTRCGLGPSDRTAGRRSRGAPAPGGPTGRPPASARSSFSMRASSAGRGRVGVDVGELAPARRRAARAGRARGAARPASRRGPPWPGRSPAARAAAPGRRTIVAPAVGQLHQLRRHQREEAVAQVGDELLGQAPGIPARPGRRRRARPAPGRCRPR